MVTRRHVRELVKRYLPSINVAHFLCSTLLLNYLVVYLVVTALWFSPGGGKKQPVVGEVKLKSTLALEQKYYTHRRAYNHDDVVTHIVCLTYVLFCVLFNGTKLVNVWVQTRRKKEAQLEGQMNGSIKQEITS
ncbi:hypothetical protein AK88_02476 [Plasmodium fragile]|uniref:Uncharacterized protein n=1 Tax=Plasmodium fragile TaxID=5857 RepID=A0A0D9QM51_PLAFR|nr:uncharacterized protein AK88_02476 [Plasmodium fragile]KJP87872.1 hypothetical protein AK88_02476 [Plasmodium fragile]